ncbi:hypothetical protein T229_12270 [Tannerella sp. oral taxon BU063 isolate Cell 5]|uniref:Uncharacterized protein n=2 Tax=Tannerella serpentiformis TaxID=712710 RepID=W2C982_9BACT|nr:hypothetical protein N425_09990 [Tannerella sp. oral taxon BU063 isolate Cell 2]ETK03814.1 hypothetical protein T229_12270 [Tannerella sp. oral taxon BU063 isolate Cell 5]
MAINFCSWEAFLGLRPSKFFPLGATERHARPLERASGAAWAQSPPSENILRAAGIYTLLLENISPASGTRKPSLEIILWATVIHTPPSENILRAAVIYTLLLENISPASGTRKPSSEIILWAAGMRKPSLEIILWAAGTRALLSENIGATRAGR